MVSAHTGRRLPRTERRGTKAQTLLSVLLKAMFLVTLVKTILQNAKAVNEDLDEETRQRMQRRSEFLSQQMARMLQELERQAVEQTGRSWAALLWDALLQWQFWAVAGVLMLLVALCWQLRKRGYEVVSSCQLDTSMPITPAPRIPIPKPTPIPTPLNSFSDPVKLNLRGKSKCKPVRFDKNRLAVKIK